MLFLLLQLPSLHSSRRRSVVCPLLLRGCVLLRAWQMSLPSAPAQMICELAAKSR